MSDILNKYNEVFTAIENNYQSKQYGKFKLSLKSASNNINNVLDVLLRKSLVKQDLYEYDTGSDKFHLPEEKSFADQDKPVLMFERIKANINMFDFLSQNVPESVDGFTDGFLENIRKLLEYISFNNYSTATNLNTRICKELTDRIVNGADEIFKKVIIDNLKVLADNNRSIQLFIEDITKIKKEKYKFAIRFYMFPMLPDELSIDAFNTDNTKYLAKLEDYMRLAVPDITYNKMWIGEAIRDCYTVTDDEAVEKFSNLYSSGSDKKPGESELNSPREKVLKIIGLMSTAKSIVEEIYLNFDANLKTLKNREKNFIEKLQDVLRKILNIPMDEDFLHIEYINPQSKSVQKDIVNVAEFMLAIKKKMILLTEMGKTNSSVHEKINKGTEEALIKFLDDTYFSMLLLKERMIGVETEIRISTPKNLRKRLKEIKSPIEELSSIVNTVGEQRRKYIIQQETFSKGKKR